jgi:peptide/nickel transport system substrate-binding protein
VRNPRAAALITVFALTLAACGGQQNASSSAAGSGVASAGPIVDGGTVRIGIGGSPADLNPGNGVLSEDYILYELIYDTPITVTADGEYVPELATDWEVSEDGLTWTLTIRDDATFHDGEPLTAEDVAYTIQLYKDTEDFPFLPSYAAVYDTIEATDATHVELTTAEPIGNFESTMAFIYVLPMHIWEAEGDPVAFENADMIGSGPFKLDEYRQDEFTQLAVNEEYWNGRPHVDGVIFQTYANADARVQALKAGDVDAINEFPVTGLPALQNAENVNVQIADIGAGGSLRDVFFNMVAPENCPTEEEGGICSGHPALQDVTVRRALATAVDKQEIIDVAYLGEATPGLSLVPIGLGDYYASDVADYAFDPEAAAQMLEDAGYVDADGNGVRECLDSQDCSESDGELRFRFHYADDIDTAPREAELLQGMWADIGVQIEIQGLDPDTLTSICCPAFDYDIMLWGWGSDPDAAFLLGVALCSEIPSGFSESGYCNPDYDDLYDQQAVETDPAARIELIHQMQRILVEDVPYIIPYYQKQIQAWRTDTFIGWPELDPTLGLEDPSSLVLISQAQ